VSEDGPCTLATMAVEWSLRPPRLGQAEGASVKGTCVGGRAWSRGMTREQLDDVTLLRHQQYQSALADDRAFQRAYMVPATLPRRRGEPVLLDADVGVHPTSAAGLAKLDPVDPGGVVTYGTQTYPADGTAGLVVTTAGRVREPAGEGVARILGTGAVGVGKAEMVRPIALGRRGCLTVRRVVRWRPGFGGHLVAGRWRVVPGSRARCRSRCRRSGCRRSWTPRICRPPGGRVGHAFPGQEAVQVGGRRLRGVPASTRTTVRRARSRTGAAIRPAGPPPTTRTSYSFMPSVSYHLARPYTGRC
jgi:Thiolase, N-terminal domain